MIVTAGRGHGMYCCHRCKTGGCTRVPCEGDGCPCGTRGGINGHAALEEVFAAVKASIAAFTADADSDTAFASGGIIESPPEGGTISALPSPGEHVCDRHGNHLI